MIEPGATVIGKVYTMHAKKLKGNMTVFMGPYYLHRKPFITLFNFGESIHFSHLNVLIDSIYN